VGCWSEGSQGTGRRCRGVWKCRPFNDDNIDYDDNNNNNNNNNNNKTIFVEFLPAINNHIPINCTNISFEVIIV
jgi:hypothetical protein